MGGVLRRRGWQAEGNPLTQRMQQIRQSYCRTSAILQFLPCSGYSASRPGEFEALRSQQTHTAPRINRHTL